MAEVVGSRCINVEGNYTLKWLEVGFKLDKYKKFYRPSSASF